MKKLTLILLCLFAFAIARPQAYVTSAPLSYSYQNNFTINNDSIVGGTAKCIYLSHCNNVNIINCRLLNTTDIAIRLDYCTNIYISGCRISNVRAGVLAVSCTGGIKTIKNWFQNMQGPFPQASCVQYSHCSGSGNAITNNKMENNPAMSHGEDAINLYQCNGNPGYPIVVTGNWIRGGGPSTSGAGITVGDGGGSHEFVSNNIVINTGAGGIQTAGGTDITITQNTIYSSNFTWSGFGLACSNYSGSPVTDCTISNNIINWYAGKVSNYRDTVYKYNTGASNNPVPAGWYTNIINRSLDSTALPKIIFQNRPMSQQYHRDVNGCAILQ